MTEIYHTSGHIVVCNKNIVEVKNAIEKAIANNDNFIDLVDDMGRMVTIFIPHIEHLKQQKEN